MAKILSLGISGIYLIEPEIHIDGRGTFFEFYRSSSLANHGFPNFVQDNVSVSKKNVIRGLHFQSEPFAQGKLVAVLKGKIFDVAVDIRQKSSTFGKYVSVNLDDISHKMIYLPPGIAHGFCALSDENIVIYKNTKEYKPEYDNGMIWNDPEIGINWPIEDPIISEKDKSFGYFNDIMKFL